MDTDKKAIAKSGYFRGEQVRFTGKTEYIHHGLFYEATYLSGPKEGESVQIAERLAVLYIGS